MARLRRRTQGERLGERTPVKKLFPEEMRQEKFLAKVRMRIRARILEQPKIQAMVGKIRERKVSDALLSLQERGEIRDFIAVGNLSRADLMGVDFIFTYVASHNYEVCPFSVTGPRWIERHRARHPELPILPVEIWESRKSIEAKILALKNHSH